jgi:2-dehydro-3-deoxyphosphogluconate aldolase / (4S)-4-hydroxy-2-oxoglutarate aldolase
MTKDEVRGKIAALGIVPVIRAPSPELAVAAARAVYSGGIPIVEITMTVPNAVDVIRGLSAVLGREVLIGAGTVLDSETALECLEAGAQFLVSPAIDVDTVQLARSRGILMMAGALTPNEVVAAWKCGSDFVKIFPCGNMGGPSYIKALKSALPRIPMVPTGGVNLSNLAQFLQAGAAAVGVGGELISARALTSGNFAAISELARQYADAIQNARESAASTV